MATLTGSAGNAPQRFASLSGIRRSGSGFEMDGMFRAHTSRDDRRDREGRVNAPPDRVFPPPEETELANLETEHPVRGQRPSWLLTGRRVSIDHVDFHPALSRREGRWWGLGGHATRQIATRTPAFPGSRLLSRSRCHPRPPGRVSSRAITTNYPRFGSELYLFFPHH